MKKEPQAIFIQAASATALIGDKVRCRPVILVHIPGFIDDLVSGQHQGSEKAAQRKVLSDERLSVPDAGVFLP